MERTGGTVVRYLRAARPLLVQSAQAYGQALLREVETLVHGPSLSPFISRSTRAATTLLEHGGRRSVRHNLADHFGDLLLGVPHVQQQDTVVSLGGL